MSSPPEQSTSGDRRLQTRWWDQAAVAVLAVHGAQISAAILVLLLGFIAFQVWRVDSWSTGFDAVARGDSLDVVAGRMGRPTEVGNCGDDLWWDAEYLGKNEGHCVRAYHYSVIPWPEAWEVGFSPQGAVVHKFHYVSP